MRHKELPAVSDIEYAHFTDDQRQVRSWPFDIGLKQALDWLQPVQRAWEEQGQEQCRDSSEGRGGLPGTL